MKYVDSGSGKIPLVSLVAILSISLTVNLPGLAVSPLLGKLQEVFPHVTEIESQLLTTLPNFVIIPFILFAGKICTPKNQLTILLIGLLIYTAAGILFLFANSMPALIVLSCVLGVGCGLVIPLAASLISQNFVGKARTKQLGMKSGISNFTVIFATLFVGWIASVGWHMAFLVYLMPIIPMALIPFMTRNYIDAHKIVDSTRLPEPLHEPATKAVNPDGSPNKPHTPPNPNFHFQGKQSFILLLGVIGLYIALTYSTEVVSYYTPFTLKHYDMSTTQVGIVTAMFFLAATCSGFTLTSFIKLFKRATPYVCMAMCVLGLYMIGVFHLFWTYLVAVFIMGFGYGILQPIIYDKTAFIAPTTQESTKYFGYTLTGNYIAIALVPFIVSLFSTILHCHGINFAYYLNGSILLFVMLIGFWKCKSYVFSVSADMLKK